jgi:hypothetical protein
MKKFNDNLNINEFYRKFSNTKSVSKNDLKQYFTEENPDLTIQGFRRILYGLEKRGVIYTSGSAVYSIQPASSLPLKPKKKFTPIPSLTAKKVIETFKDQFPYSNCIYWETRILHNLMTHQPRTNMIIIETDKDSESAVFNHFISLGIRPTFLDPDRTTIDRYVGVQDESIIVSKLISQSPKRQKGNLLSYAKLEKILVDILVDENKYYVYQGRELSSIFENAFDTFFINQDSMLRYSGRRTAQDELKLFILNKTNLKLRVYSENSQ